MPKTPDDPFVLFRQIFDQAVATGMADPNAMVVATVDPEGRPSTRVVLLKHFDERGFVFFTNFESRKGRQILANPNVCLHFHWRELDRQVSVEGTAEPVSDAEADAYFSTRPHGSQLGAWASQQSRPLPSRRHLLAEVAKVEARFFGRPIPRPPHWSGFRIVPRRFEFWRAGRFRLHDRTLFERTENGWTAQKLYP